MAAVYTFGETVYDIIFEGGHPVAARAGGAMLNTAVSLGRCNHQVTLLTEMGDDPVGNRILAFLRENNVNTEHIYPYNDEKTPVALAFLDENMSASYSFYKKYPEKRLEQKLPELSGRDIVLFGSFYSLSPKIRGKLTGFIRKAKAKGAAIIYDPNIRKNHLDALKDLFPYVLENIALADIVRGSDEDFTHLFNSDDTGKILPQLMERGCKNVIITRGSRGAELLTEAIHVQIMAKNIKAVSTIGAGDSFNAGIIHGLDSVFRKGRALESLDENDWKMILEWGSRFAENACTGYDNYVSHEFAELTTNDPPGRI